MVPSQVGGRLEAEDQVAERVRLFAPSPQPILIEGETGTGKTMLAARIHELSDRSGEFVRVDVPWLHNLGQAQLRGHVRGAFTGASNHRGFLEQANHGTLMLDDINTATPKLQQLLLGLLERREVLKLGAVRPAMIDVRFIFTSNVPLRQVVETGTFAHDLYQRIKRLRLRLPPLRYQPERIIPLALHLLQAAAERERRPVPPLSPAARRALRDHSWPGNIRELDAALGSAVVLTQGVRPIEVEDLDLDDPPAEGAPEEWSRLPTSEEIARLHAELGSLREVARVTRASERSLYRVRKRARDMGAPEANLI